MKPIQILLFICCAFFLGCTSGDDPDQTCLNLQSLLDEATNEKFDALEAYSKDTSNPVLCENYAEALRVRIEQANLMINQGCLTGGALIGTEESIQEDMEELNGLVC